MVYSRLPLRLPWVARFLVEAINGDIATRPIDLKNRKRHSTANGTIDRQTCAASVEKSELKRLKHKGTEVTEEALCLCVFLLPDLCQNQLMPIVWTNTRSECSCLETPVVDFPEPVVEHLRRSETMCVGAVPRVRCATLGYGVEHLRRSELW